MGGMFGGGGGGKSRSRGTSGPDPMMAYFAQMQSQQAAQAEAARRAQQEAILESQRQSALAAARQGEAEAQQLLSQAGTTQKAKDIASSEAQKQAYGSFGTSAVGGQFDLGKAKEDQAAAIGAMASSGGPIYGMSDTLKTGTGITGKSANIFNLPKASGLTFGGQ